MWSMSCDLGVVVEGVKVVSVIDFVVSIVCLEFLVGGYIVGVRVRFCVVHGGG